MSAMLDSMVQIATSAIDADAKAQIAEAQAAANDKTPSLGDQLLESAKSTDMSAVSSGMNAMSHDAYEKTLETKGVEAAVKARESAVATEEQMRKSSWAYGA